jgi:hypothetical protein
VSAVAPAPGAWRRRVGVVAGVGVVAVALAAAALVLLLPRSSSGGGPPARSVATAAVVRTDLATTTQVPGVLGFAGATTILAQASGAA